MSPLRQAGVRLRLHRQVCGCALVCERWDRQIRWTARKHAHECVSIHRVCGVGDMSKRPFVYYPYPYPDAASSVRCVCMCLRLCAGADSHLQARCCSREPSKQTGHRFKTPTLPGLCASNSAQTKGWAPHQVQEALLSRQISATSLSP